MKTVGKFLGANFHNLFRNSVNRRNLICDKIYLKICASFVLHKKLKNW